MTSSNPNISDPIRDSDNGASPRTTTPAKRTVDDVWREIVAGKKITVKEMKEEPDFMMTLEDFLVKKGAVDEEPVTEEEEVKFRPRERMSSGGVHALDYSRRASSLQIVEKVDGGIVEFRSGSIGGGGGRGKRGRAAVLEPLDKAAERRQRRMIKNRESAARSRERKQAYQVELESLAIRLEEEQEQLLKEKDETMKQRFKQLMELVIPVLEKRRPSRSLRRVQSLQW